MPKSIMSKFWSIIDASLVRIELGCKRQVSAKMEVGVNTLRAVMV